MFAQPNNRPEHLISTFQSMPSHNTDEESFIVLGNKLVHGGMDGMVVEGSGQRLLYVLCVLALGNEVVINLLVIALAETIQGVGMVAVIKIAP